MCYDYEHEHELNIDGEPLKPTVWGHQYGIIDVFHGTLDYYNNDYL